MLDASIQFAWGLHYAHERGFIHQDVKPLNALMWDDMTLKVSDFGLAGARSKAGISTADDARHSILVSSGAMTPPYCSPEQAAGEKLDRGTDVWSWAVSVLQMFEGEITWHSGTAAGHALELFQDNSGRADGIPAMPSGVGQLLQKCLQSNKEHRVHSLKDCAEMLSEEFRADIGTRYYRSEPLIIEESADALNNKALSLLDLGASKDCVIEILDQALSRDNQHPSAIFNRGLLRWRSGKTDENELIRFLNGLSSPEDHTSESMRGWACMVASRYSEALAHFERSIALGGEHESRSGHDHAAKNISIASIGQDGIILKGVLAAYSPDGRYIATVIEERTILIIEAQNRGELVRSEEVDAEICHIAFTVNSNAVTFSCESLIGRWEWQNGIIFKYPNSSKETLHFSAISPDARFALTNSTEYDQPNDTPGMVGLWDVEKGKLLGTLVGYSGEFTPVGKQVLTACDSACGLWECDCKYEWEWSDGYSRVGHNHLRTFSLDGSVDLTANSPVIRLECQSKWSSNAMAGTVACSRNEQYAITAIGDGTARMWNLTTGECIWSKALQLPINYSAISPNSLLTFIGGSVAPQLLEVITGICLKTFQMRGVVTSLSFSPCGSFVLYSDNEHSYLHNIAGLIDNAFLAPLYYVVTKSADDALASQTVFARLLASAKYSVNANNISDALQLIEKARSITGYKYNPDALALKAIAGLRCRRIKCRAIWIRHILAGHTSRIDSLAISRDGLYAMSESKDGVMRVWSMNTGKCLRVFEYRSPSFLDFGASHNDTSITPDGQFSICGVGNEVNILHVPTGECVQKLLGHTNDVSSVNFSQDARFVISAGGDFNIRIWEVDWDFELSLECDPVLIDMANAESLTANPVLRDPFVSD
jgi:WD40 repeat protein